MSASWTLEAIDAFKKDWVSQYIFTTIKEEQDPPTEWLWSYSSKRPYMAISGIMSNGVKLLSELGAI